MSATASMANLSLTTAQEKVAWRDVSKQAVGQRASASFSTSVVGATAEQLR